MKRLIFLLLLSGCNTSTNLSENVISCPSNHKDDCATFNNTESIPPIKSVESSPIDNKCPSDMIHVVGDYCNNLEEVCLEWGDPNNKGANGPVQCLKFRKPNKCLSNRTHLDFCMDTYPLPNMAGQLPTTLMTWYDVKNTCEKLGKRLCTRNEFTQACRGPLDKSYPYGDGFTRDCTACNCDKAPWLDPATHSFEELDKRVPLGSMDRCVSDYNVHDMVGNNDRWVRNESGKPYQSALMGGHAVLGARNRCSPATLVHNESFKYYETGGVCCQDVK